MRRRISRLLALPALMALVGSTLLATAGPVAGSAVPIMGDHRTTALAGPCDTFPCYTLTVDLSSSHGSGSVTTTDAARTPDGLIDCRVVLGTIAAGSTCSHRYVDTQFAGYVEVEFMTIAPEPGFQLCIPNCGSPNPLKSNGGIYYSVTLQSDKTLAVQFERAAFVVSVSRTGTGTGTVTSVPAPGIACGAVCQAHFEFGTSVTLTAIADAGASFTGWTGACAGQDASCVLTIPASNISTNAVFTFGTPTPTPTPPASGLTLSTSAPIPPGAKDPVILWGDGFTLAAVLGSGQASRSIALQGTRDGVSWTPIRTLTTASSRSCVPRTVAAPRRSAAGRR